MDVFTNKEATEDFLDYCGLMGEICQVFLIKICDLLFFELFTCIKCSKLGLNFDSCCFFLFELFSFHIHFKFRLYF